MNNKKVSKEQPVMNSLELRKKLSQLEKANKKLQAELMMHKQTGDAFQEANLKLSQSLNKMERRNFELTSLSEMGELLQACLTTEEAYSISSRFLKKIFPEESGAVYLSGKLSNIVEAVVIWGEPLKGEEVFSREDCWAFRKGHIHVVDVSDSGDVCRHIGNENLNGYICMPMMAQGNAIGMMHLQRNLSQSLSDGKEGDSWTGDKMRLASVVAEHLSLAFANLKLQETLREQAVHDSLTGLYNRRYMMEMLEREVRRAVRSKLQVGVIMIDLDHFKRINDTYGHEAGDVVLREIGGYLETHVRQEDIVCRYGGEEFLIIMPGATLDVCESRARAIGDGIKYIKIQAEGHDISGVSVSIGISISQKDSIEAADLLKMADAALYSAKKRGRDMIVIAEK